MRLFEASGDPPWLDAAQELAGSLVEQFRDPEHGGFFFTAQDQERLIVRSKDATDNATPSGNAMAATALLRLAALTSRSDLEEVALGALRSARGVMAGYPSAAGQSLIALEFALGPHQEVVVCEGAEPAEFQEALEVVFEAFAPRRVVAPVRADCSAAIELAAGRTSQDGLVTAYFCENHVCRAPAVGLSALSESQGSH